MGSVPHNPFIAKRVKSAHRGNLKNLELSSSHRVSYRRSASYRVEHPHRKGSRNKRPPHGSTARRRQTHLQGRNELRLCLGKLRCGFDALLDLGHAPETLPFPTQARLWCGIDVAVTLVCHFAARRLLSAVPVRTRLYARAASTDSFVIAGCHKYSDPDARRSANPKPRGRGLRFESLRAKLRRSRTDRVRCRHRPKSRGPSRRVRPWCAAVRPAA